MLKALYEDTSWQWILRMLLPACVHVRHLEHANIKTGSHTSLQVYRTVNPGTIVLHMLLCQVFKCSVV